MIPFAAFLTPNTLKLAGVALGIGAVFFSGWWVNGWRWGEKYQKLEATHTEFVNAVAREGEQAKTKNALIALSDLKKKERIDEENRRRHTADINTILRLRRDADRARSSFVPPAPAASRNSGLACFDRPALESAVRGLVEEVRGLVDAGTAATVDLDTAKQWAQTPRSE